MVSNSDENLFYVLPLECDTHASLSEVTIWPSKHKRLAKYGPKSIAHMASVKDHIYINARVSMTIDENRGKGGTCQS